MTSDRKLTLAVVVACALLCAATTVINLATQVSGVLPVLHGGTGQSSFTANCVLVGASPLSEACPSVAGQVLTDNGSGSAPTFSPAQAFIDLTSAPGSTVPISAAATTLYLDFSAGFSIPTIALSDGVQDGQLLTIVCNSSIGTGQLWDVTADFDKFGTIVIGGGPTGSYDLGTTFADASQSSCSAELMWSNANGWWELVSLFGGVTQ